MRARLKRRYPRDHRGRKRWTWIVRYQATDGTDQGDTIGFWTTDPRDTWRPKPHAGRTLPRISERQARDRLRKYNERIERGEQDKPAVTQWELFAEDFLDRTRGTVKESSIKELRVSLDVFGELCSPQSARAVNQLSVKKFIQQARATGRREATINKYLDCLRRVWNGEFPNNPNPFKSTRSEREGGVRRFKVPDRDWHRTTPEQLRALLRVCDHRWQAMIQLSYSAALRVGEVWNLTWDDVSLDQMIVNVNPKDDTTATWRWTPKDHERRVLPLTAECKLALMRIERSDVCPYVFVPVRRWQALLGEKSAGEKERFVVLNNFLRQYHARCRWAGVPEDDFHSLRKTCITNWLEDRVPPHEVQRLAGHSSIETTIKYYSKVDRGAIDRARQTSARYSG